MSSLVFSFNTVAPVFLLVAIGWLARKVGLVGEHFVDEASKLNFRTGLPALLFLSIYQTEGPSLFNWKFIGFMTGGCMASALVLCLFVPKFIRDRKKASAFIHCVFKPNMIVLGFPLALMAFGKEHSAAISMLMPVLVPANNIAAVLILCALDPEKRDRTDSLWRSVAGIVRNPIILAAAAAILLQQFQVPLPSFLLKLLSSLSDMATPFALITLGAQMTMKAALSDRGYVISATVLKVLVTPLVIVPIAYFFGFRGYELAAAFIVSASPSAVNSYMLAREMRSDEVLTGEIILGTTFCSMFVIFIGIYMLKAFAVIA
ncbi:AEC family transporter [Caproicibacter sp. BJN0012]|uniref:AEC family transporter n=1 Tax=Caproicibacter sp. BJN0012 TaxID=3110227 RepID=UPI002E132849